MSETQKPRWARRGLLAPVKPKQFVPPPVDARGVQIRSQEEVEVATKRSIERRHKARPRRSQ